MRPRSYVRFSVLLVAFAILGSCENTLTSIDGLGVVSAEWDSKEWHGYGYAILSGDTLRLVGHRPDPVFYYDEVIQIKIPSAGVGNYTVQLGAASLEKITGGDGVSSRSAEGELRVTYVDSTHQVRGRFSIVSAEQDPGWRLESGTFDVPVYSDRSQVPVVRR